MSALFGILAFAAFVAFIIGMIKPKIVVFWSKNKNRKWAALYLPACFVFIIIASVVASPAAVKSGYQAGLQASKSSSSTASIPQTASQASSEIASAKPTSSKVESQEAPQSSPNDSWNKNDNNTETNGNAAVALQALKGYTDASIVKGAQSADPSLAMKAPWKYYGKVITMTGTVAIIEDYAPGSDTSKNYGGGEVCEIAFECDDGTPVDYMNIGATGDIKVGDSVKIYGLTAGQINVDNKLGGKTEELCIFGKGVKKATSK